MKKAMELMRPVVKEWLDTAGPHGKDVLRVAGAYANGPSAAFHCRDGEMRNQDRNQRELQENSRPESTVRELQNCSLTPGNSLSS